LDKYKPPSWKKFKQDKDGFENCFTTLLGKYFSDRTTIDFIMKGFKIENKNGLDICLINIKKSDKPIIISYKNKDTFFARKGNSTRPLTGVRKIAEYVFDHFKNLS